MRCAGRTACNHGERATLTCLSPLPTHTGALYDVVNSDALSLVEGDVFDRVYCLAR